MRDNISNVSNNIYRCANIDRILPEEENNYHSLRLLSRLILWQTQSNS